MVCVEELSDARRLNLDAPDGEGASSGRGGWERYADEWEGERGASSSDSHMASSKLKPRAMEKGERAGVGGRGGKKGGVRGLGGKGKG